MKPLKSAWLPFAAAAVLGGQAPAAWAFPCKMFCDDFSAAYIAPQRWYGEEEMAAGGELLEVSRSIVNGELRIRSKTWADNDSSTGFVNSRNSLLARPQVRNSKSMAGTVTMRTATALSCETNDTPTVVRARLFGYFFNVGSGMPTSHVDDVFATVQLYRSSTSPYPPGTLRVAGIVGRCTDASCNRFETLGTASMGTVDVGTPLRLSMYWKGYPYYAFSMTRALPDQQQADYYTVTIPYGERHESISQDRRLEVSSQVAHCSPQRAMADGVADFDEVYVDY